MEHKVIAIDGPAGSGKSTISRLVANKIGFVYVKTGEMFRSITYMLIKKYIDIHDIEAVEKALEDLDLKFEYGVEQQKSILNGEDITEYLTQQDVNSLVSKVSEIKVVRDKVEQYEHEVANSNNVVMEGRDIGTVIFPNADLKIFLNASIEERAKRRYEQRRQEGHKVTYEEVKSAIIARDENDKNKKYGALRIPKDAIVVNSDGLEIEQTVGKIIDIILEKLVR